MKALKNIGEGAWLGTLLVAGAIGLWVIVGVIGLLFNIGTGDY